MKKYCLKSHLWLEEEGASEAGMARKEGRVFGALANALL